MEYFHFNDFENLDDMRMDEEIIKKIPAFKYLGTHVTEDGELDVELDHRIQCGWNFWRKLPGVLCDKKMTVRLKGSCDEKREGLCWKESDGNGNSRTQKRGRPKFRWKDRLKEDILENNLDEEEIEEGEEDEEEERFTKDLRNLGFFMEFFLAHDES
eukprot:gene14606-5685_t